ncbi:MAG: TraR/DksA C4-type zinc finger protein [Sphingomonadales bacterium]|nr:TraR/DksA C4-type zinc finger protein [Sphingomonadales bacterium]
MNISERQIEAGEAVVSLERDTAIARIRAALEGAGEDRCIVCDEPINPARRAAIPSAERCIGCQTQFEKERL